jgi:hypothetical protein
MHLHRVYNYTYFYIYYYDTIIIIYKNVSFFLSHQDLMDKVDCVSYVRQIRTSHIMTKCIEINVTSIIII